MKKVTIITVNFNQPLLTKLFLNSVAAYNTYPAIEIIVVDNGSHENRIPTWQSSYPKVRFIRSEKNLGFAGGNNLAIREANGDYLLLVNNDTEFSAGLIENLVTILDSNPNIGAISPKILYFDKPDIIQYAGFTKMNMNTGRNRCIGQMEHDMGQYDNNSGPTGFVHGAAMMLRKEAIKKAGLMPELFFLYYEEMDWCEKIRKAGFEIWIEPKAKIYHKESMSVGKKSLLKEYFMCRNRILFIRRNAPWFSRIIFYFHFLILVTPRNLLNYLLTGNKAHARQFLRGILWNFRNGTDSKVLGYKETR
ncbi:MAG: glycosyl transferase [Sphingobacteriales bacterium 17-39-43]|uniref:glycosyltransferase family 2 protein n=1 Tax=Daejeonella sp. TaxID=2805397 RepID=UPI000BDAE99B|nr:glycosyltransferase family 2 protein [Daejeonella sp.]OYZ30896.1 MAG: glycosyl transferase [Sphingobacteriales bacterium 16-39-50]OZA23682.1 MAG: glycosyl transferase [Sphingobacteriales bacterium 17-39-43]HQT23450.1 glycosyltransferase family 2 protein [Daejeonella sp.]HQT58327.1 glycosyltransferase family 2 protein [Daejeonella sp.]